MPASDLIISEQDLKNALKKLEKILTPSFSRRLIGEKRLEVLEQIQGKALEHRQLVEIILRHKHLNLLAERPNAKNNVSIRKKLFLAMDEEHLKSLWLQLFPNRRVPKDTEFIIEELSNQRWVRGSDQAVIITRALGLPMNFAGVKGLGSRPKQYEVPALVMVSELKPFQKRIIKELEKSFVNEQKAMISSFTGTGKTRMGLEFAISTLLDKKSEFPLVFWIAQKRELLDQACDSLEELWPHRGQKSGKPLTIYRYMDGEIFKVAELPEGPIFVAATSQQVLARLKSEDLFLTQLLERTQLLVIDEAHYAHANGHRRIIETLSGHRQEKEFKVLGLTATPGRSNIENELESRELAELFDRNLIVPNIPSTKTALEWFQEKGYLSRLDHRRLKTELDESVESFNKEQMLISLQGETDFSETFLHTLGRDTHRNRAIVKEIANQYKLKNQIIVFCCSILQAETLSQSLTLQGISSAVVHHHVDRRDRRIILQQFKNKDVRVLLNVEVLTTGFDAPKVNSIIIARPTVSRVLYEQMVGRGLRGLKMGGTKKCNIIDFTGNFENYNEPLGWQAFWKDWESSDQETGNEFVDLKEWNVTGVPA